MSETKKFFWNYKSKCYDIVEKEIESDSEAVKYIPNTRFANTAYFIYRRNGVSAKDSMNKVLLLFLKDN